MRANRRLTSYRGRSGAPGGSLPRRSSFAVSDLNSTFVTDDYTPPADGVTSPALVFTANDAAGSPIEGATVTYAHERVQVSASLSIVTAPGTVAPDAPVPVTIRLVRADGSPAVGIPATFIVLSASGLNNTLTQPVGVTDATGSIAGASYAGSSSGARTLTVTVGGLTLTSQPVVTVNAALTPDLSDDFSTYTDTTDFRSDPLGLYNAVEEDLEAAYANVNLDTTLGYGPRTQSMRVSFLDATAEGGSGTAGRCTNAGHSAWREIALPANTTELWLEVALRFDADFSFGGGVWGCTSAPEQKLFLFGVSGGTGRFNLECTNGQWVFGYPGGETASVIGSPDPSAVLFDATFHVVRFYLRLGAGGTGRAAYSIDGTLYADLDNVTINRTSITTASLNETRNQGAPQDQAMHIGLWNAYVNGNNPGWTEFA